LEHTELLSAGTQHDQTFDLIVYFVRIIGWLTLLPIGTKGSNELLPVDEAFAIAIEQIGYSLHFQARCIEF